MRHLGHQLGEVRPKAGLQLALRLAQLQTQGTSLIFRNIALRVPPGSDTAAGLQGAEAQHADQAFGIPPQARPPVGASQPRAPSVRERARS